MKKKADPSPQELKPTTLQSGRRKHPGHAPETEVPAIVDEAALLAGLRGLIQSARQRIATAANATTTLLFGPLLTHRKPSGWPRGVWETNSRDSVARIDS